MKTSKLNYPEFKKIGVSLMLACSSMVFMAGCQKEESAQPGSDSKDYNHLKQAGPPLATFAFITIDHYAANTSLPDYSVSVKSNGIVVFEGKRNVAYMGRLQFEVPPSTINNLKDLFIHSNFFNMRDEIIWSPDLPINSTTYAIDRSDGGIKTLHDRESKPAELVALREKAESLLHISKYIIKSGPVAATASTIAVD